MFKLEEDNGQLRMKSQSVRDEQDSGYQKAHEKQISQESYWKKEY